MFKELKKGTYEEVEQQYIDYWKENDILQKSIDKSNNYFVFYDGPATANGHPGLHHMVAKFLKDSFCKYKTMQGYKVLRKVGWDTHGLPVEVEAEKKLGFNSKKDIENYQKNVRDAKQALVTCKEIVSRYDVNMQLTNCEYTLDKAKVILMYTSDDRVDFRELLKELAVVFKCRIELRQIGPRDKAKVIGGIGTCGLPLCCTTLLGEFNGVSINMAKNQMLAINIEKISGS